MIYNDNHLSGCEPAAYKSCILDQPIEGDDSTNEMKSVTFRIVKSTGTWIGLGLCHKNIVIAKNYYFNF
jgi:hypothetical protein